MWRNGLRFLIYPNFSLYILSWAVLRLTDMNDEDIRQFLTAFSDFMKHSDTEIQKHEDYLSAKEYTNNFLEEQAKKYEVTVDYYMAEFLWIKKNESF